MDPTDIFTVIADDVATQAFQAHLEKKPEVAEALYGVANAIKRALAGDEIAMEPVTVGEPWHKRLLHR